MAMTLEEFLEFMKDEPPLKFSDIAADDRTPDGAPGIDLRILTEEGDPYYRHLAELLANRTPGMIRLGLRI